MIKVSIIVPVYNVQNYLARCLDSLINQTIREIEIICVNDGSTDDSAKILYEYANKDSRVKIIEQANGGLSTARNTGIANANGEFIGLVDSDDFVDLDFYEKLYNAAKSNNADIACGNIVRENDKKKSNLLVFFTQNTAISIKDKALLAGIPKFCFVWNKIYNRQKLLESGVKFVDGLIYEDMVFTPQILEKMGTLVCTPNTFYHYWKHANTLIKTQTDKTRADKLFGNEFLRGFCRKYNIKQGKSELIKKKVYKFFKLPILKIYEFRATKKYLLFGVIPVFECEESI